MVKNYEDGVGYVRLKVSGVLHVQNAVGVVHASQDGEKEI